ncbi:hypothetical protein BVRB_1g007520 [Beta vulgaris subsp. vulgaris]|nr:hypothetical protein BVRB_1g007520 [Beta vulgaris subsp. vulgaris]
MREKEHRKRDEGWWWPNSGKDKAMERMSREIGFLGLELDER